MSRPQDAIVKLSRGESVEVAQKDGESASGEALPEGWARCRFDELAKARMGKTILAKHLADSGIPVYSAGQENKPWGFVEESDLTFDERTIVVSARGSIGFPKLPRAQKFVSTQTTIAATCEDTQGALFVCRFLESLDWQEMASGGAIPMLTVKRINEIEVPVPPLGEQSRIVSAIESLQERSSRARVLLSEVGPLIGQLRQSVLRDAFSGKLTADWRARRRMGTPESPSPPAPSEENSGLGAPVENSATNPAHETASELLLRIRTERRERWQSEQLAKYEAKGKQPPKNWQDKYKEPEPVDESELPELPDGWCWASLDEIAVDFHQGINTAGDKVQYAESGYQILQAKHITSGRMEFSDARFMTQEDFDNYRERYRPHPNYILFTNIGTIGKSLVVAEDADVLIAWNIFMIELENGISPTFVNAYFNLLDIQGYYDTFNRGNATRFVNRKQMAKIPFPICPAGEQCEVSRIVDAFNEIETSLAGQVASMESSLTQLDQSILSKAFRGELVPQDPRDEPAWELLARIRTTRETAATKTASKKNAGKKPSRRSAAKGVRK